MPPRRRLKDPAAGWQLAAGIYALCQGVSWALTPRLWAVTPSFKFLREQPFGQVSWTLVMFGYFFFTVTCLTYGKPVKRAALGSVSAIIWFYLGIEMIAASWTENLSAASGFYEILLGVGMVASTARWARYGNDT